MPVILVVDDSETDRMLIRGLLERQPLDWIVDFAESAEQAILRLNELAIDVVVTDMNMPGMSGLELLEFVKKQPCRMPVILVSGQGSEELAVEAIEKGASSYVAKDQLASRLVETIKQVIHIYESEQSYSELIESVEDMRFRFRLANDPALIPPLVNLLQQITFGMKLLSDEDRVRLGIALDEAIINAMYHGNLELPPEDLSRARASLRDGETVDVVETRRTTEPYAHRHVHVDAVLSADMIEVTVRDDGHGFSQSGVDDDQRHRGLTLMRALIDKVSFNDAGNEVRLTKFRSPTEEPEKLLKIDETNEQ